MNALAHAVHVAAGMLAGYLLIGGCLAVVFAPYLAWRWGSGRS